MSGKRGPNASSVRTKAVILDAALRTLRDEGIADTSARAIARAGDFNQALIFYHFGSVDDALAAAFEQLLQEQHDKYSSALASVRSEADLDAALEQLFSQDLSAGITTTIAQGFAGATHRPHMGPRLRSAVSRWLQVIEQASVRAGKSPEDATRAVTRFLSVYIGYEILNGLRRDEGGALPGANDVDLLRLGLGLRSKGALTGA